MDPFDSMYSYGYMYVYHYFTFNHTGNSKVWDMFVPSYKESEWYSYYYHVMYMFHDFTASDVILSHSDSIVALILALLGLLAVSYTLRGLYRMGVNQDNTTKVLFHLSIAYTITLITVIVGVICEVFTIFYDLNLMRFKLFPYDLAILYDIPAQFSIDLALQLTGLLCVQKCMGVFRPTKPEEGYKSWKTSVIVGLIWCYSLTWHLLLASSLTIESFKYPDNWTEYSIWGTELHFRILHLFDAVNRGIIGIFIELIILCAIFIMMCVLRGSPNIIRRAAEQTESTEPQEMSAADLKALEASGVSSETLKAIEAGVVPNKTSQQIMDAGLATVKTLKELEDGINTEEYMITVTVSEERRGVVLVALVAIFFLLTHLPDTLPVILDMFGYHSYFLVKCEHIARYIYSVNPIVCFFIHYRYSKKFKQLCCKREQDMPVVVE